MFQMDRIKNDLIIRIDFRIFVMGVCTFLATYIGIFWMMWVVAIRTEINRIRNDVYVVTSQSLGQVLENNFNKNHAVLLQYESCQAELKQAQSINKDLSHIIQNTQMQEKILGETIAHPSKK